MPPLPLGAPAAAGRRAGLVLSALAVRTAPASGGLAPALTLQVTAVLDWTAAEAAGGDVASLLSGGFAGALGPALQIPGAPLPDHPGLVVGDPSAFSGQESWVSGPWGPCSETCGAGQASRTVECSAGQDRACAGVGLGPRPAATQECEDFTGCPFELDCPLGRRAAVGCAGQLAALLSAAAVAACCAVGLCCRRVYRMGRVKSEGRAQLAGGIWGTYRIVRDRVGRRLTNRALDHDVEQGGAPEGKTHIIWEVDLDAVRGLFSRRLSSQSVRSGADAQRPPAFAAKPGDDGGVVHAASSRTSDASSAQRADSPLDYELPPDGIDCSDVELDDQIERVLSRPPNSLSRSFRSAGSRSSRWRRGGEEEALSRGLAVTAAQGQRKVVAYPAIADGQKVEYFSDTHARWLPGIVHVRARAGRDGGPRVRYDVEIVKGQRRCHVSLDQLREPLQQGELVEVFSRRRRGFLPGAIEGEQAAGAATLGYKVLLEDADEPLCGVPAAHLRRRFGHGQAVRVYRGPEVGWAAAEVARGPCANDGGRLQGSLPRLLGAALPLASGDKSPENSPARPNPPRLLSRGQLPALRGGGAPPAAGRAAAAEARGGAGSPAGGPARGRPQHTPAVASAAGAAPRPLGPGPGRGPRRGAAATAPRAAAPPGSPGAAAAPAGRARRGYEAGAAAAAGAPRPTALVVRVEAARGLRDADWLPGSGASDPYCVCEIRGKPHTRFQTPTERDTLDPVWNYEVILQDFVPGDELDFTIMDRDVGKADDMLGSATVASEQILPSGFEGELPLLGAGKAGAFLRVAVGPEEARQRPELWEWVAVLPRSADEDEEPADAGAAEPSAGPPPEWFPTYLVRAMGDAA